MLFYIGLINFKSEEYIGHKINFVECEKEVKKSHRHNHNFRPIPLLLLCLDLEFL